VQIVAHRGAAVEAPENTLSALECAWRRGAPWCEVDVQRTADDVAVLVHDDSWKRTAGLEVAVRDAPWSTVSELDVGAWFSSTFAGETVPRLEAVLAWKDRLSLNLEIKSPENDPGLADAVATAVRQASAQPRTLLSCFDVSVIDALASRYDDLQLGYLGHAPVAEAHPRVHWQILEAQALLAHPEWCEAIRSSGCHLWAWTVDRPQDASRLQQWGVEALITNDPRLLLRELK